MAVFTYIETDTGTNVDISAATAVGAYTSTGDKLIMVDVSIDAVAGNGDYVMYVTRKIGGSGSAYRILPQTTMTAASGLTAISGQSGWITVRNGDVLTCYVDGLAGDTSTPDWTTRWYELAGVTAAAVADAVLDEATSGHTSAGSFSKAVTDILADTGTDGVKIASAQTVATVTNLTNLPAITANWLTGTGVDASAVTKLQANLALEATLTAIKGAGWTNETLADIMEVITAGFGGDDLGAVLNALEAIKGAGWTNETLYSIQGYVMDGFSGENLNAVLYALNAIDVLIDAIKAKTDQLAFTVANQVDANALTGGGAGGGATAADVWSHATRTLTVPAVAMSDPNEPTTLMLYRDADINIEFTGLTIPTGAKKVVFTIKDNLDDADTLAVLQATYELTAVPAETHTLNYINSAAPPELTTPVTFTVDADSVEFDMTAAAAYYLPRYERGYLNWDLKLITATSVQILQQGLVQILGTSTRKVA